MNWSGVNSNEGSELEGRGCIEGEGFKWRGYM